MTAAQLAQRWGGDPREWSKILERTAKRFPDRDLVATARVVDGWAMDATSGSGVLRRVTGHEIRLDERPLLDDIARALTLWLSERVWVELTVRSTYLEHLTLPHGVTA